MGIKGGGRCEGLGKARTVRGDYRSVRKEVAREERKTESEKTWRM